MDELTRARIFEPFFTTKVVGKGSGLGLWSVRQAVEHYHGAILVDSGPGRGTTFRIYLPRTENQPEPKESPSTAPQGTTQTILVVDDVDEIREMMKRILEEDGYRVLAARSGPDALEMVAGDPQNIGLVLTDMRMPGMDGPEMVSKLRAVRPGIKVSFLSGYSDPAPRGEAFLSKPFTAATLLKAVQTLLRSP